MRIFRGPAPDLMLSTIIFPERPKCFRYNIKIFLGKLSRLLSVIALIQEYRSNQNGLRVQPELCNKSVAIISTAGGFAQVFIQI